MPDPFQQMQGSAFDPIYADVVAVSGERAGVSVAATAAAAVFEQGFDDPSVEDAPSTTRRAVEVLIPFHQWRQPTPPQRGDALEVVSSGMNAPGFFHIESVAPSLGDWRIQAREAPRP